MGGTVKRTTISLEPAWFGFMDEYRKAHGGAQSDVIRAALHLLQNKERYVTVEMLYDLLSQLLADPPKGKRKRQIRTVTRRLESLTKPQTVLENIMAKEDGIKGHLKMGLECGSKILTFHIDLINPIRFGFYHFDYRLPFTITYRYLTVRGKIRTEADMRAVLNVLSYIKAHPSPQTPPG
jgi:hypothetical protein